MATKRQRRKRRLRASTGTSSGAAAEPPRSSQIPARDASSASAARPRGADGPPQPPWGSFPLSELVVLVAIVLLAAGFFVSPPRGTVMIGTGLALGSLAGLELAAREHFAGYRSHTLLLAGAVGVVVAGALFLFNALAPAARVLAGAAAFVPAAWAFAEAFRRRSGGALYRFKA